MERQISNASERSVRRAVWMTSCGFLVAAIIGCGSGDGKLPVSGKVTIDGQAVDGGDIVFVPANNPSAAPEAAPVMGGQYSVRLPPGPKKVMIRWERQHPTKTRPGPDPSTKVPLQVQAIPQKYNDRTELTADITKDTTSLDFTLQGAIPLN